MKNQYQRLVLAFQLLTRLPMPRIPYSADAMAASAIYFPFVGVVVGGCAVLMHLLVRSHLPASLAIFVVLLTTVLLTGALHEDGLADTADAFGAGGTREKILQILKDSRIGSYGALALIFSIGARYLLLLSLPESRFTAYVIVAHVLCRWTALPLAMWLPSARDDLGQGSQLAGKMTGYTLLIGSILAAVLAVPLLRTRIIAPLLAAILIVVSTGVYYKHRIGGITGDCFGATNQLTEIAVYLCGIIH